MELRALEIAFALLRPRGFLRRLAVVFAGIVGLIAWWMRAVNGAAAAVERREQSRSEIRHEVARRTTLRRLVYEAETGASTD